jgi:3-oxoacyl-[acyl-carrier-protein] synthase II
MGHTLGACGALEAWMTLQMMREGWFAQNANLTEPDPRCGAVDFIMGEARQLTTDVVMSNNFAFGGINTSLIFKRWSK